jgi:thiosulfate/3-mercaptopyruvate sulfurtransferase
MTDLSLTASQAQSNADVGLVDATWILPDPKTRLSDFLSGTPHSIDCDAIKAAPLTDRLQAAATEFGVAGLHGGSTYAVYDRAGLFSAPWIWWMLRSFGVSAQLVEGWSEDLSETILPVKAKSFEGRRDPHSSNATKDDVLFVLGPNTQIIDARPPGRFSGESPEPRPECRAGHIPGSFNVPFGSLKSTDDPRRFRSVEDLKTLFETANIDLSQPIITTCGSGVTASGLAFCLVRAGAQNVRVYQGSWAEWGVDPSLPIETGS